MGIKRDEYMDALSSVDELTTIQKIVLDRLPTRKLSTTAFEDVERTYLMIEDDMSHMEDVFLYRQLPFPEYLVRSGYYETTREMIGKTCAAETDKSATSEQVGMFRKMMNKYGLHFRAVYEIPCASGRVINVSVISGKMFYSRTDAPYEVLCSLDEDESGTNDPRPYQTDEDLMLLLAKLIGEKDGL